MNKRIYHDPSRTFGVTLSCMDRYNAYVSQAQERFSQYGGQPFTLHLEQLSMVHAIHAALGTHRWNQVIELLFRGMPPPFHLDPVHGHYRIGQPLPFMTPCQQARYAQVYWNMKHLIWCCLTRDERHVVQGVALGACIASQSFLSPILAPITTVSPMCNWTQDSLSSVSMQPSYSSPCISSPGTPTGLSTVRSPKNNHLISDTNQ